MGEDTKGAAGSQEMNEQLVRVLRAEIFVGENEERSLKTDLKACREKLKKDYMLLLDAIDGKAVEAVDTKSGEVKAETERSH